jgi:glutaredoxin 3
MHPRVRSHLRCIGLFRLFRPRVKRCDAQSCWLFAASINGRWMKSVIVYTTSYCPYCVAAKRLLERKQIPFEEIDVTHDDALRLWLVETTGRRTVPQIFIGGVSIGGYDELAALEASGELDVLLQAA